MTNDRADQMPEPPAWMRLDPEALRVAWQRGQAAPAMSNETLSAVALLVRPVVRGQHKFTMRDVKAA